MHIGNQQKATELLYKYYSYLIITYLLQLDVNNDMFMLEIFENFLKNPFPSLCLAIYYMIYLLSTVVP